MKLPELQYVYVLLSTAHVDLESSRDQSKLLCGWRMAEASVDVLGGRPLFC